MHSPISFTVTIILSSEAFSNFLLGLVHPETTVFTSKHIPEFSDIKKQCQVYFLKEKNNIEITDAVQHHNAMRTCISKRNVIVSEKSILQNVIKNISNFFFKYISYY